jgi:hypothetical protein
VVAVLAEAVADGAVHPAGLCLPAGGRAFRIGVVNRGDGHDVRQERGIDGRGVAARRRDVAAVVRFAVDALALHDRFVGIDEVDGQVATLLKQESRMGKGLFWMFVMSESGAAYVVSYMMVLPFIMTMLAVTIETVFYFQAAMGLEYASQAAARSATVWYHHGGPLKAREKALQAAVQGMLSQARGMPDGIEGKAASAPFAKELLAHATEDGRVPMSADYLARKIDYAYRNMNVEIRKESPAKLGEPWRYEFAVTVSYRHKIGIPLVAMLLGFKDGKVMMSREALIGCEAPQNKSEQLGIPYERS